MARGPAVSLPRIALTVGDPAGIGPEIVAKAAADPGVRAVCEPVIFAPPANPAIRIGRSVGRRRARPPSTRSCRP